MKFIAFLSTSKLITNYLRVHIFAILYSRGTPSEDPPSAQDRQRFSERAQRFGRQGAAEGNKNIKKKISIDELLKRTLVSPTDTHTHTPVLSPSYLLL